jgi:hypothetical protein
MKCIYRISDGGYKKIKFGHATKKNCLLNFLQQWPIEEVLVLADNVNDDTAQWLWEYGELTKLHVRHITGGSSAQSFRIAVETALELPENETVYLVEDDYWHLDNSRGKLLEGIQRADYVTLYDAPDKYIPASLGGNPFIEEDGADPTKVILTKNHHWRLTNSTTCTFATKVSTLKEDLSIWTKWCFPNKEATHPHDFQCFLELREKGRSLLSPIPTLSTHVEPNWAAPLVDWEDEMGKVTI